jgi:hypothetical protein
MIIAGNIKPFLATPAIFILRPLYLNLTATPTEHQDNTRHLKPKRIVFSKLNA